MEDAARLTQLEERYAHLQRHVGQQDKAMLEMSDELAKLRRELSALRDRLAPSSDPDDAPPERPPHY